MPPLLSMFMTLFVRLNHLSSSLKCPVFLVTRDTNFDATTWSILQSTDPNEQIKLDLMTDFNYKRHILTSNDKLDVALFYQPDLILDTTVELQLNALFCQQEKNLSDHNSFQITLYTVAMVSETNQICDQAFLKFLIFR